MNRIAVLCIVVIPQLEEKEPFRECEEERKGKENQGKRKRYRGK